MPPIGPPIIPSKPLAPLAIPEDVEEGMKNPPDPRGGGAGHDADDAVLLVANGMGWAWAWVCACACACACGCGNAGAGAGSGDGGNMLARGDKLAVWMAVGDATLLSGEVGVVDEAAAAACAIASCANARWRFCAPASALVVVVVVVAVDA